MAILGLRDISKKEQPVIEKEILDISQHLEAAQKVNMDESDSNDSDSKLSDMEITTKTTTKTYDDEINEGVASRRTIRDFQQVSSRNRWPPDEKRIVLDAFGHDINSTDNKLPTFNEIGKLIKKHSDLLGQRSVPMIKMWVHNKKRSYKANKSVNTE
ncbi:uncharacterized protein LOC143902852 [Temnothorax americanus]|uniref:uncharacterized protein LOC143902852 n=1 Tax=Temnothorax americanus TaxID=1964332 RepID=UPI00406780B7